MKILIYAMLLFTLCSSSCKKESNNEDQLPPATQTGANRIGCLLDGKAFLPGNSANSTNCFYQIVSGEYYFVMAFGNEDANFNLTDLGIGTRKKQIFQGQKA